MGTHRFGSIALACVVFLLLVAPVRAQEALAEISRPAAGETLDVFDRIEVAYRIVPGARGDHSHIYIDDAEVGILRALEGTYPLASLEPGEHTICVKVVNKAHVPIGVEHCVGVIVSEGM